MKRNPIAPAVPEVASAKRMLARNTHRLRRALGMTQLVASERAGLDPRHWQKIEGEETNACLTTLARVAAALDVQIRDLFAPLRPRS